MSKYIAKLQLRLNEDRGATAVEYGLLVVFIALVMVAGATFLGKELDSLFSSAGSKL